MTIVQPLIAPLYQGRTIIDVLAMFIDAQLGKSSHDLVKDYWTRAQGGKVAGWTITDTNGQPFANADSFWKHALHDGFVTTGAVERGRRIRRREPGSAPDAGSTPDTLDPRTLDAPASSAGGLEIIFRPDPTIWDGRFANNGWLQELPKPLTKITWDPDRVGRAAAGRTAEARNG